VRCAKCGKALPVQTGRGRRRTMCEDCSPRRERQERREPVVAPPRAAGGDVEAATLAELAGSGREASPDGVVALRMARLIDDGEYTAQGAAALVKAHSEAMTRAMRNAAGKADVVDELLERRRARRSG